MDFILQARDFRMVIQANVLAQITGNQPDLLQALLDEVESVAIEEATDILVQRFDVARAFASLEPWSPDLAYKALARVYLDAAAYVAASTYNTGDITLQAGIVYSCIVDGTTGVFAPGNWTALGSQYTFFNAPLPHPEFTFTTQYALGDPVWWNDYTYVCLIASRLLGQEGLIQYGQYQDLPLGNVDPENVNMGSIYWGSKAAYTIPAGTLPTDTDYWTAGDARSSELVRRIVAIMLYWLHQRIAPENVPELRETQYKLAIKWLTLCKDGERTPNIPVLQPIQGTRVRYGGNVKNENTY